MTTNEIEKRLTALEAEMADLRAFKSRRIPWWDKIAGAFADNPRFDKAMRTARESPELTSSKSAPSKQRPSKSSRSGPRTSPKASPKAVK